MDKPKWYSKAINMAVVLSVLLSLMGLAVLPVAADGPDLGVTVDTDMDYYCVCNDIIVTATITNSGDETAQNVTANITWDPLSGAHLVSGSASELVGNVTNSTPEIVEWTLHCDEVGSLNITVDAGELLWDPAGAYIGASASGLKEVEQVDEGADLYVVKVDPPEGVVLEVNRCENFTITFNITNNGTVCAELVNAIITPSPNVEGLRNDGTSYGPGNTFGTSAIAVLAVNETHQWEQRFHCAGCDEFDTLSTIHIDPMANDCCTDTQMKNPFLHSKIYGVFQKFGIDCEAEPNPSKVCHNVTFTAWIDECAEDPVSWNWTFGDGNSTAGTGHDPALPIVTQNHYVDPDTYNATVTVTDAENITSNCTVTNLVIYPRLTAACNVTPFDYTKLCHNLTFNGTAVGGFPGNMCNYTWEWDFGDNSTPATGPGYSSGPVPYHYNATGNYTAVFTIGDDCLNNTANCSINITVFPPLDVLCSVSSNVTKVCHNVTFNGTAIDGIPDGWGGCGYNWTWDFGDNSTETGCCLYDAQSVSHHYNASGNYCATFTIQDNCWNNTANCTTCVEVFPGLDLICDGYDSTVCNAVNFTAKLTGGVPNSTFNWTWDFGDPFDATNATTQNATHTYMCTGNYTATVTVCDDLDPVNCANCTVNVTITIEPPELHWPTNGDTVTVGCNNTVCFEWENIGCCNYTLQIWQKEEWGQKVWNINTGKDNFACVQLWDNPVGWRWQVVAVDACGEWVVSDLWFFNTERDCMYADVTVTRPNGGETFTCNTTEMITWDVTEYGTVGDGLGIDQGDLTIDIYYSTGGGAWTEIATGEENDGAYGWFVPEVNSNQCLVKVRATDGQGNVGIDVSDGVFTIECAPPPTSCTTLYTGWNLYASPLIPDNPDITNVTAAINGTLLYVTTYNASSGLWPWYQPGNPASTLTTIEAGVGYWITMNMTDTLCIVGKPLPDPPAIPPTYDVVPGWNLIGFKSTVPVHHSDYLIGLWSGGEPNYSVIWSFDGSIPEYVNIFPMEANGGMMEPGHGFWLWATAAGQIVPTS